MSADGRIDTPAAVRPGEELDAAALLAWWRRGVGPTDTIDIAQFPRGFSNLTYAITAGGREYVLRRPPHGVETGSIAHDVLREGRLLAALHPALAQTPRVVALCDDAAVIGAPFFVMERVHGVVPRPGTTAANWPAGTLRALAHSAIDTLAGLHAVEWRALGLEGTARPDGYIARQVGGWTKRWLAARTGDVPQVERVAAWLADHQPAPGDATLVHNDYKLDNLVLDPADPSRIVAVLDWEMATIGDPRLDLATTLGYWLEPGDPPPLLALGLGLTAMPGSLSREEVVQAYQRASGHEVGDATWLFAFGLFKVAVIAQQIFARYVAGHTRDPRFARLDVAVQALGSLATRAIDAGRVSGLG